MKLKLRYKGGAGSGFHDHSGRPGEVGGSSGGTGSVGGFQTGMVGAREFTKFAIDIVNGKGWGKPRSVEAKEGNVKIISNVSGSQSKRRMEIEVMRNDTGGLGRASVKIFNKYDKLVYDKGDYGFDDIPNWRTAREMVLKSEETVIQGIR